MAGTVETSIVLNAVDNTKSALNSVQSNLEKLVHEAVKVSNGFSKIDTSGLDGFKKAIVENQNKVMELRSKLADTERGTYEYIKTTNQLNKALREGEIMWKQHDEAIRQENASLNADYIATKNQEQVEEQLTTAVQKNNTSLLDNIKNLFSHREATTSNTQAQKYWEEQIRRVEDELSQASIELSDMEKNVNTTSDQLNNQKEYIRQLELQLKEYKKQLKDTTANMTPFQLAIQKLGKNIKSLFLLHAAKNFLSGLKNLMKSAINEFVQGGLALEGVVDYFDTLAERGGMDAKKLRNALREASRGMITDVDLMTSANKAMLLGVGGSVEQMSDLMKIAVVRGQEMGESATKSFNDIVLGIGRLSPKILDNLGIIIKLQDAYDNYANKIGKSSSELTKAEQQMAVMDEVIRKSTAELEMWGNGHLTVADKMQVMKVKGKNALDTIGGAFFRWLEPIIDGMNDILDEGMDMADDLSAKMDSASTNIWVAVSGVIKEIWQSFSDTAKNIWETFKSVGNTIIGGLSTLGNAFWGLFSDISTGSQGASLDMYEVFMHMLNYLGQGVEGLSLAIKQLWEIMRTGYGEAGNWLKGIGNSIKGFFTADVSQYTTKDGLPKGFAGMKGMLEAAWGNAMREFGTTQVKEFKTRDQLMNESADGWVDWGNGVIESENRVAEAIVNSRNYVASKIGDISSVFGGDDETSGGGGGGGSASKETEKMSEEMKELIKEMEDYGKQTREFRKDTYENIIDSMEECVKEAEKLAQEVSKLQEELDELNGKERSDIAEQYVKSEEKLKDLEEQYSNIKSAVEDLGEAYIKSGMGRDEKWGDIDRGTLREYIDLQAQLKSAYEGLNEEGIQLLDEQIQKQKEYNELNDIEKIKFDYEEKRKVLEADIAEKQALIQKEIDEYNRLNDQKIEFEGKWLDYMRYSYQEQQKMNSQLISQLQRIIELQRQAGMGGGGSSGHRAGGGVVYGGESYIVGEHGPELFTPNVSGKITPNNQITNNNGIEVNINGAVVRSDGDIQAIADEIIRQIKLEKNFGIS